MDWASATGAGDEASAAASRSSALRRRGSREKERRRRAAARVALSALTIGTHIEILRGTRQIAVDAARAFHWIECIRWPLNERALRVAALERVLGRVFMANVGGGSLSTTLAAPFYIQGAHDVGALLLLELGEARAGPVLHGLTNGLMRGFFSHDDIEQPLALLSLIPPALKALNPALSSSLFPVLEMNHNNNNISGDVSFGGPTLATLPWVLTWFTHASSGRAAAAALFNGLLAIQHPLAPVYAAAALIASPLGLIALSKALGQHQHTSLFTAINAAEEGELHAALTGLPASLLTSKSDGIALAISATALTRLLPPRALLALAPQNTQNLLRQRWPELWNEIRCDGGGSAVQQEDDFVASGSVTIGTYAATFAAALVTLLVAWTAMKQQ
jgi:hypothetical protein